MHFEIQQAAAGVGPTSGLGEYFTPNGLGAGGTSDGMLTRHLLIAGGLGVVGAIAGWHAGKAIARSKEDRAAYGRAMAGFGGMMGLYFGITLAP